MPSDQRKLKSRIINEKCLSPDIPDRDEAPESAILAKVPVITHYEQMVRGHLDRTKIVFRRQFPRKGGSGGVTSMRVDRGCTVNKNLLLTNLDGVTPNRDYSFDKVLCSVVRIYEHDYVADLGVLEPRPPFVREGNANTINKLINKDVITHKQGWLHGTRRDFKGLDE